jgi:hypothetical protein
MTRTALLCVVLMLGGGCANMRHGRPVVGGSVIANPTGTIAGHVRTTAGTGLDGRRVAAIDLASGMRYEGTTSGDGGYSIKVPEGRYRMEVELREGDQLAQSPKVDHVNLGDLDEGIDFVIRR